MRSPSPWKSAATSCIKAPTSNATVEFSSTSASIRDSRNRFVTSRTMREDWRSIASTASSGDRIVGRGRLAQDARVAEDAREWAPQLVRGRGDEVALHPVQLAQLGHRGLFALQQIPELVGLSRAAARSAGGASGWRPPSWAAEPRTAPASPSPSETVSVLVRRSISAWMVE